MGGQHVLGDVHALGHIALAVQGSHEFDIRVGFEPFFEAFFAPFRRGSARHKRNQPDLAPLAYEFRQLVRVGAGARHVVRGHQ